MHASFAKSARGAIALHAVTAAETKRFLGARGKREAQILKSAGFAGREGDLQLVSNASGGIAFAVLGLGKGEDALALATFSEQLPAGIYKIDSAPPICNGEMAAIAWALGTYQFARYRKAKASGAKLVLPRGVDGEEATRIAERDRKS